MGSLADAVREALDAGRGELVEGKRALPLVTLESGARVALVEGGAWALLSPEGALRVVGEGDAYVLHEVVEQKRADFDAALEGAARAAGLDADAVVLAFPSTAVVRVLLDRRVPYLVHLALRWLVPTELREVREEIVRVSKGSDLPLPVRELAQHLVVPE
jgi:hypothetical protein